MNRELKINKKLKVIGIIPARGGSKAVPRKNIKLLGGKPLLFYMLNSALGSNMLDYVVVSSEDDEILDVAKKYGKKNKKLVLIKRPKYLAKDNTFSPPVLEHATRKIEKEKGYKFDYVVMLQVTTPFVTSDDIDRSIKKIIKTKADSVVSVHEINDTHPVKIKKIVNDMLLQYVPGLKETILRRQDLSLVYKRNGGIYVSKRDVIMKHGLLWGKICRPYIMPPERSVDINNIVDFYTAEAILKNNIHKRS